MAEIDMGGVPDFDALEPKVKAMLRRAWELGIPLARLAQTFKLEPARISALASRDGWVKTAPSERIEGIDKLSEDLKQIVAEHRASAELPSPEVDAQAHDVLTKSGSLLDALFGLLMQTIARAKDGTLRHGKAGEAEEVAHLVTAANSFIKTARESAGIRPGTPNVGEGGTLERKFEFYIVERPDNPTSNMLPMKDVTNSVE